MTEVIALVIIMFSLDGQMSRQVMPVTVPVCQNGLETSGCGIKACMQTGRERAATIWGRHPGTTFGLMCSKNEEIIREGTEMGGGHPGLGWRKE
jgi:hypothetical protein